MLPRLIIAAILVNLSWHICSLAIDVSNVFGIGLRGVFSDIKETALAAGTIKSSAEIDWASAFGVIATGGTIAGLSIAASGGLGAFFWMIIPALLGALVAVVAGLITIAARQAVVALLLMLSPLAFVAYLIPNTEKWFTKWKQTLYKMLIFFPMFSFLFGASDLIGWTIITSAIKDSTIDAFGLILGLAVQVFPLFFAFSLMKMSGTALGAINGAVRKVSNPLQKSVGSFASGERELRRQQYLASKPRNFELTKRFAQGLNDRKYRQAADAATFAEVSKNRGAAFTANYKNRRGAVSRRGERLYDAQKQNLHYQGIAARTAGDFDNGLAVFAGTRAQKRRLDRADGEIVLAADRLKYELERNAKISYENDVGYYERTQSATTAHYQELENQKALRAGNELPYKTIDKSALARYATMSSVMNGKDIDVHFIGAGAANAYDTSTKVVANKFSKYFDLTAPTAELHGKILELANHKDSSKYIDPIITGLRSLNMRGDTDLVGSALKDILNGGKVELGTHASQALASFLMFDVKDNDPLLRRFGKYINLETAHVFNDPVGGRKQLQLGIDEYITGHYTEPDGSIGNSKRAAAKLLEGTSLDNIERTALSNLDSMVRGVYGNDVDGFKTKRAEIQNALWPAFIGANLKFASGSEQISSAATFLTGLEQRDGVWNTRWTSTRPIEKEPLIGLDRKFFLDQTKTYLGAQTPNQIFSLRTDLLLPIVELFSMQCEDDYQQEYLNTHPGSTINDVPALSSEERKQRAYAAIRKVSDDKGTLEQMYLTRRSGAANNSKAMVREIYGLDNEEFVNQVLADKRAQRKRDASSSTDNPGDTSSPSVWSDSDRAMIRDDFAQLLQDDPNSPTFYDDTYKTLKDTYGLGLIAHKYQDYHRHNLTANNDDLLLKIFELLDDDSNF